AGGVLMRSHDRRVDADVPGDPTGGVGDGLQPGQHLCPGAVALPAAEQPVDGLPGTVAVRDVPPRGADADAPADSVDELAFRPLRWTAGLLHAGQQRSQTRPLRVGQVRSPRYRYAGHEVSGIFRFCLVAKPRYRRPHSFSDCDTPTRGKPGSRSLLKHALGLAEALDTAETDPGVQAVLLIGAGRHFIGGADIHEFGRPRQRPYVHELCTRLENLSKPVVAAVSGATMGGGLEVAVSAHYRVAAESARLALPEVRLGLLPGSGGTQRVTRLIGVSGAL